MTFRWYRSRSFWFGLLGLVMLVGSFVFYARTYASVDWDSPHQSFQVAKSRDMIVIHHGRYRGANLEMRSAFGSGLSFQALDIGKEFPVGQFLRPFSYSNEKDCEATVIRNLFIAPWFVVLIYILLWLSGMIWWLRRKQRLMHAAGVASIEDSR